MYVSSARRTSCFVVAALLAIGAGGCGSSDGPTDAARDASRDGAADAARLDAQAVDLGDSGGAADASLVDSSIVPDAGDLDAARDAEATDVGPEDRRSPIDGAVILDGSPDGGQPDGSPDTGAGRDAAAIPPECLRVIDLAAAGTRTGSTTRYVTENTTAPIAAGIPGPAECRRTGFVGAERVFLYTPARTAALRVSTNYPTTNFDTIAWALDRCAATGAIELGCNDDANVPPRRSASTFVTPERRAGEPLYIVVGGYLIMTSSVAQGDFDLRVTELSRLSAGQPCDPQSELTYCASGSSCTRTSTRAGTPTTCAPDGMLDTRCRASGMACDAGLGCNAMQRCVRAIAAGGACDPARVLNVCAPPGACVTAAGMSTCVVQDYVESTLVSPTFVDACGSGIHVTLTDRDDGHSTTAIALPFPFRLFGTSYTEVWPDTNGFVSFGPIAPADSPYGAIPIAAILAAVAPFYEDLVLRDVGSDICYLAQGTAPNRRFILEWLDAYAYNHNSVDVTFEVILNETTNAVDFVYSRLEPTSGTDAPYASGAQASVGLQNADATRSLRHSGTVSTASGIRFAPP